MFLSCSAACKPGRDYQSCLLIKEDKEYSRKNSYAKTVYDLLLNAVNKTWGFFCVSLHGWLCQGERLRDSLGRSPPFLQDFLALREHWKKPLESNPSQCLHEEEHFFLQRSLTLLNRDWDSYFEYYWRTQMREQNVEPSFKIAWCPFCQLISNTNGLCKCSCKDWLSFV